MGLQLLVDFGSTFTKAVAVDLERELIVGCAQAPTTIEDDITIGLDNALAALCEKTGIDLNAVERKFACSSAAGGLKIAAVGLVPALTLEAARRAALGAGAKVVSSYGYEIDEGIVREIEALACDIVMLCGGFDGGNKNVILHNAGQLARSSISSPILVAGNRVVTAEVKRLLESGGKKVYTAENVLPETNVLNPTSAQNLIREIFIAHIVKAKNLDKAQLFFDRDIIPTPKASLLAASLLEGGENDGLGSAMVVEIGGATINIHSVAEVTPATHQTIIRGLPETRVKRTVEGDLGIRWNSPTIFELVGQETLMNALREAYPAAREERDFKRYTDFLYENVNHVPRDESEYNMDIALAKCAAKIAVERHCGELTKELTMNGEVSIQHGKNLLEVQNIVGTGGIFRYGLMPERILPAAVYDERTPWSLKPKSPKLFIDRDYILFGVGLLAQEYPEAALRIAKKYLASASLPKNGFFDNGISR